MKLTTRAVFSVALVGLVLLGAPPAVAQQPLRADDEDRRDQRFEAIMMSVRADFPNASGFATIILPSPRWWPLNRFMYVRVEAEGLPPNTVDDFIHLHSTRTDAQGFVNQGCFGNAPVVVNLNPLRADANGKAVSVTRIVLTENSNVFSDATRFGITGGAVVTRSTLTRWYVQYHIPRGLPNAGSPMACGEITTFGFDRGAPFQ